MDLIRERTGDRYFLMKGGDATFGIPDGQYRTQFVDRLIDEPEKAKTEVQKMVDAAIERAEELRRHGGIDGFALNTDYCDNRGPFLSPATFGELVTPYLEQLVRAYRDMGFYVIKHTDGNIMPILDQLVQAGPHALHSLDPQGGVDLAEVKRRYGDRVCLIGNVNCSLLQSGSEDDMICSARQALRMGMPDGGYVFSTSNCIYTGADLSRYELMLDVRRSEGNYEDSPAGAA